MIANSSVIIKDIIKSIIVITPVIFISLAGKTSVVFPGKIVLVVIQVISKIQPVVQAFYKGNVEVGINIGEVVLMPFPVIHIRSAKRIEGNGICRAGNEFAFGIEGYKQWLMPHDLAHGRFGPILVYK